MIFCKKCRLNRFQTAFVIGIQSLIFILINHIIILKGF